MLVYDITASFARRVHYIKLECV